MLAAGEKQRQCRPHSPIWPLAWRLDEVAHANLPAQHLRAPLGDLGIAEVEWRVPVLPFPVVAGFRIDGDRAAPRKLLSQEGLQERAVDITAVVVAGKDQMCLTSAP